MKTAIESRRGYEEEGADIGARSEKIGFEKFQRNMRLCFMCVLYDCSLWLPHLLAVIPICVF